MEFYDFVSNVGFPIAVSAYLLLRIESKLDKLAEAITTLEITTRGKSA